MKLILNKMSNVESSAEKLRVVARIVLAVGVVLFIVLCFTVLFVKEPSLYRSKYVFQPIGLLLCSGTLLFSIITWSLLNVVANISTDIHQLNRKHNS